MFHFHKWSRWARTDAVVYRKGEKRRVVLQYRQCNKCGRTDTDYL